MTHGPASVPTNVWAVHPWAVDEVPGLEASFLVFDDQDALAHQDQEVPLHRLRVVEARRPAGRHHSDREPGLRLDVLRQIRSTSPGYGNKAPSGPAASAESGARV